MNNEKSQEPESKIINDIQRCIEQMRAIGENPDSIRMSEPVYLKLRNWQPKPIPGNSHQRRLNRRRIARFREMFTQAPLGCPHNKVYIINRRDLPMITR